MALVKCPECGRENVSDTAESCPNCGYGIKAHYDKIKQEEQQKLAKEREERELEENFRKMNEEREANINERAQYVDVPQHKPFMNGMLAVGLFFGALTVLAIICEFWGFMFVEGIIAFCFIFTGWDKLKIEREIFDKYSEDKEKYQREIILQQDRDEAEQQMVSAYWKNAKNGNGHGVKCPYCQSTNVKKITTTSRAISVGAVGVASGKIGKQWHCNNCRTDF